jgi:hypothetical protein
MMGYKNAPSIEPRIGDEVACGLPGDSAIVSSIDLDYTPPPAGCVINCAVNGRLHLNMPSEAVLVRSVDGFTPKPTPIIRAAK